MAFAILKLSYKFPGQSPLEGGICGTGFFVTPETAVTAHHVLNKSTFQPNPGCLFARVWVLLRTGEVIPVTESQTKAYPDTETTLIKFGAPIRGATCFSLSQLGPKAGQHVDTLGHLGNEMPSLDARWDDNELQISGCGLEGFTQDASHRKIKEVFPANVKARDMNLTDVQAFEILGGGMIGQSGGPTIDETTGKVVGLLSFGLPQNLYEKTSLFAISSGELHQIIE